MIAGAGDDAAGASDGVVCVPHMRWAFELAATQVRG